jgi:hypothetical protein
MGFGAWKLYSVYSSGILIILEWISKEHDGDAPKFPRHGQVADFKSFDEISEAIHYEEFLE